MRDRREGREERRGEEREKITTQKPLIAVRKEKSARCITKLALVYIGYHIIQHAQ
jgi:hypothetical protein